MKIVVEKVRINATLPDTLFKPEFPAGVQFLDATPDGRGKRAIRAFEKPEQPVKPPGKE